MLTIDLIVYYCSVNSYMGTRLARSVILKEVGVNPLVTIAVPVAFHGCLDFYAFISAVEESSLPILRYLIVPVNLLLIGVLMTLCRRYVS
jgi:hypothetical protein